MRFERTLMATAAIALVFSQLAFAQRHATGSVRITSVTPASVTATETPVAVTIAGSGFVKGSVVRARTKGVKGAGVDCATTFTSATALDASLPADLVRSEGALELRVKNPDESVSDWTTVEVRNQAKPGTEAPASARRPVIERISPAEVPAGGRNIHVTVHGSDLLDGSTIELLDGALTSVATANLVNGTLVFVVPADQLTKPHVALVRVIGPDKQTSDKVELAIVAPKPADSAAATGVSISDIDPSHIDMRGVRDRRIEIIANGADEKGAKVLIRAEGDGSTGKSVPVVERSKAANGTVLAIDVTPTMLPATGAYEIRVVNPDGRQSNWFRFEVVSAGSGTRAVNASVAISSPSIVTLTTSTITFPLDVDVENLGGTAVHLAKFALVTPDGRAVPIDGSIDIAGHAKKSARLEAPAPLGLGTGSNKPVPYRFSVTYEIGSLDTHQAAEPGRYPQTGELATSFRNEIAVVAIGREYSAAASEGGAEGWRFFKQDNPANADSGAGADFLLFAEPLGTTAARPSDELANIKPDPEATATRSIFYLTLLGREIAAQSKADARFGERGTRLGYVATSPSEGLVPLYRWVRMDGKRAANHYLTVHDDASGLPRQMQRGGWTLDTKVGYVVPRVAPQPKQ